MICCEQERTSKYCPDCGSKIVSPLDDLADHLRANRDRNKAVAEEDNPLVTEKQKKRAMTAALKWNSWLKALVELKEKS